MLWVLGYVMDNCIGFGVALFRDYCIGFWEMLCVLVFWEVEILGGLRNGVKV